jgi:hypothetical protein
MAVRKLMRYGRSLVLVVPHYAAKDLGITRGDVFVCTYDDERKALTYQPYTVGGRGPGVDVNGVKIDTIIMP